MSFFGLEFFFEMSKKSLNDCTGLSTKCTLIKTGFKNLRTGTEAKFRPFVDSLHVINQALQLSTTAAMILSLEGFF